MAFIAGRYTATWNALAIGQTADGIRLTHSLFSQLITGDGYASSPQDAVHQGAEASVQMNLIEYDTAALQTIKWPVSATKWNMGVVGQTHVGSALAKELILTAVANTPAAATPATITAAKTILHEGFPVEVLFAPALRTIPIRLRIYPVSGVFATET